MGLKVKTSRKKKINLLMISSTSSLGGGTKHMFSLGENLGEEFKVFYALPINYNFSEILNSENHILISERKITLKDIFNLKNFVKRNSIDIIHAHGKGAGVIARILLLFFNMPLIYTFHGIHLQCHNLIKRLAYIFYEYLLGRLDSRKVLVSQSEKSYAKEKKIFLGNKSIIIRNGVSNMPRKGSQGIEDKFKNQLISSKIKVISLCRFVDQKNIKDIVKIACMIPNLDFFIIGYGPLMKEIKSFISKLKISNVFLIGEKKSVFEYLYSSDIYLSTSLYEGLPISILEAMSIGLPIVASNVIGNCDTIENGKSGFLYELKEIDVAANYLVKLSSNNELRKEMGNSAFLRQRKLFSKDSMITNYKDLYREELA